MKNTKDSRKRPAIIIDKSVHKQVQASCGLIYSRRPTMKSQAEYCAGCYYFEAGGCNVILEEGEECEDRVVFSKEEEKRKK
jgi:hypothetical protein